MLTPHFFSILLSVENILSALFVSWLFVQKFAYSFSCSRLSLNSLLVDLGVQKML